MHRACSLCLQFLAIVVDVGREGSTRIQIKSTVRPDIPGAPAGGHPSSNKKTEYYSLTVYNTLTDNTVCLTKTPSNGFNDESDTSIKVETSHQKQNYLTRHKH